MTNTHLPPTFRGEPLPVPGDGVGPFELISLQVSASGTSVDVVFDVSGIRHPVQGTGSDRVAAFADAARRAGVRVGVPIREVHDWDGATSTVTSFVRCMIDGHQVDGAGVARERGESTMRAMVAAANAVVQPVHT